VGAGGAAAGGAAAGSGGATAGSGGAGVGSGPAAGAGEAAAGAGDAAAGAGDAAAGAGDAAAGAGDAAAGAGDAAAGADGSNGTLSTTLALNAPVVVSSYQNDTGNVNTGDHLTNGNAAADKWCANGRILPSDAILDLGTTQHTLTSIAIDWENWDDIYQYKVEVSDTPTAASDPANATWTLAVDRTDNMTTYNGGDQSDALTASGRFVRLTITDIPLPTWGWPCAWEISISGY
jgi:hypothetical protein